jgi:hypothetical protein
MVKRLVEGHLDLLRDGIAAGLVIRLLGDAFAAWFVPE